MKTIKLLTIFALFCCWNNLRAQTVKDYYLEIPNTINIPTVVPGTGEIKLVFSNSALTNAFDNYKITNFELAFPGTITPKLAIVYFIQCEPDLIEEIAINYSGYFARHSEIMPSYDLYIPNDYYGSTMDQSYLDFIEAPDAWDISTGDSAILGTGESVFVAFPELSGKTAMVGGSGSGSVDHGTQVAVAMAGNTDNSTGIASIGFNSQIRSCNGLSKLILLADAGARAINYSRAMPESCSPTPVPAVVTDNFEYVQAVMDELWERGVVVIASAGNGTVPCPSNPNYYVYPASLNHVISVTSVGHRASANSTTDGNRMDILEYYDWIYFDPSDHYTTQYNDMVDLSAPGYDIVTPNDQGPGYKYNMGTSFASPIVTGIVGLMVDANPCLYPDEIESILKLTSVKNDLLTLNLPYTGQMGVGRVNAHSAVEMAADMQAATGVVKVQDRVLDRFDYDLRTNPYAILMTNNKVTGNTTIDFTAKNYIDTASGDYNPGAGWVDFKINAFNTECNTPVQNRYMANMANSDPENSIKKLNAKLYPNPNSGKFTVLFDKKVPGALQMSIADVLGKIVYTGTSDELSSADINAAHLPSGVYFLRLAAEGYNQTIKFIKQ